MKSLLDINNLRDELLFGTIEAKDILCQARSAGLPFRWHPLGFVVCKVTCAGSLTARLHIWPPDGGKKQDSSHIIHDHIFNFTSWVLAGEIINTEYHINLDGCLYAQYNVAYEEEVSMMIKTDSTCRLKIASQSRWNSGAAYKITSDRLHASYVCGDLSAVTVLLTRKTEKLNPRVFGSLEGADRYEFNRTDLTDEEVSSLFERI